MQVGKVLQTCAISRGRVEGSALPRQSILPFGLRSAPNIFSSIGDAIEWIVRQRGVELIFHYVDDFIVVGEARSHKCSQSLAILLRTCEDVGAPNEPVKCGGPASCLTVLGIEVETALNDAASLAPRETCSLKRSPGGLERSKGVLQMGTTVFSRLPSARKVYSIRTNKCT